MNFIERFQNPIIFAIAFIILLVSGLVLAKGWKNAFFEEMINVIPPAQDIAGEGTVTLSLINLNTASAELLETLPGIGPSYAQRIIEYRETHGGFKSIEEIQNVQGIGEKTFERLKDKITVE